MICQRCGRRITKSASPAFQLGPRCFAKMFPVVKQSFTTPVKRDSLTEDMFPLTDEFVAQLKMLP